MFPYARRIEDVRSTVDRLTSLNDGERAILDVISCGQRAVPFLRDLLLARERSGLYQVRRRVIQALAGLSAERVLLEFLRSHHEDADAVERFGDEAAMSLAAGFLRHPADPHVFSLLLDLAERLRLPGAVAALGRSGRVEAIPTLVDSLREDGARFYAERALAAFGPAAVAHLMLIAHRDEASADPESETAWRGRSSALRILRDIGIPPNAWPELRDLLQEKDPGIRLVASEIALASAPRDDQIEAVHHMLHILEGAGAVWRMEIEEALISHFDVAEQVVQAKLSETTRHPEVAAEFRRSLLRIIERGRTKPC